MTWKTPQQYNNKVSMYTETMAWPQKPCQPLHAFAEIGFLCCLPEDNQLRSNKYTSQINKNVYNR